MKIAKARMVRGIDSTNQIDRDMGTRLQDTTKLGHSYVISFFVLKLLLLTCVIVYTSSVDVTDCECAGDPRRYVIQWGGAALAALSIVALFIPEVFTSFSILRVVMMTIMFVFLYCVLTYFPMLRSSGCDCAEEDVRRWIVEGITNIALAIFVLSLMGPISV